MITMYYALQAGFETLQKYPSKNPARELRKSYVQKAISLFVCGLFFDGTERRKQLANWGYVASQTLGC